jgi:hypothetical protein
VVLALLNTAGESLALGLTEQVGCVIAGEEDGRIGIHRRLRLAVDV